MWGGTWSSGCSTTGSRTRKNSVRRRRRICGRYGAGTRHLSISYAREGGWSDDCNFLETQDTVELLRILRLLWERKPAKSPPPMKVGVTLMGLVEEKNRTPNLFEKDSPREKLNAY